MVNRTSLTTVILTMLFSFVVTSVVWAECTITINPSSGIQGLEPGDSIQLTAETTCDGVVQTATSYTWEIETDCIDGGSIDQIGLYTAPDEECSDTIRVTDTANGNISAIVPIILSGCEPDHITILPSVAAVLPGESVTFIANTTCGVSEPNPPSYTWEIAEGTCTGGSIDPNTGTYTAGEETTTCFDTIKVTNTTNDRTAVASITVIGCLLEVTISGPDILGSPCPDTGTYTTETTCGDDILSGTYSWELDGVSAGTGNTSNTFDFTCTDGGTKTLMVTDTANGNITDSIMIECQCPPTAFIETTFSGCGRTFFYSFGVVTIQSNYVTLFGPFTTVSYDYSPLVLPLPRLVNRRDQKITQFVILLPSILFPAWDYPTTVEVTVDGLSDAFEIPACGQRQ